MQAELNVLVIGVDIAGGEDLNTGASDDTINGGDDRFVVRSGAKGELLEGLFGGDDGGDFLIAASPFIDEKLR